MLTETNLDESMLDNEVFTDNFIVFRNDRNDENNFNNKDSGGGVLIAVERSFRAEKIGIDGFQSLEQICVKVILKHRSIFLVCVYFPPNTPAELYEDHVRFLETLLNQTGELDMIIVYGDFNLPKLNWKIDNDENFLYASNATSKAEIAINEGFLENGLRQVNNFNNDNDRKLDLIFTNVWDHIEIELASPLIKNEKHHNALTVAIINVALDDQNQKVKKILNYKKANLQAIIDELDNIDWTLIEKMSYQEFIKEHQLDLEENLFEWFEDLKNFSLTEFPVDLSLWKFSSILGSSIIRHVPIASINVNSSSPLWFNKDLMKLRRRKSELHKRMKSGCLRSKKEYEVVRRDFKALNNISYKIYVDKVESELKLEPKKFFDFVNSKKQSRKYPTFMNYQNTTSSDQKEIADMFGDFFKSVYDEASSSCISEAPTNTTLDFSNLHFTPIAVLKGLSKMDASKGPGPDGIPPSFIKNVASAICVPLSHIFSESLASGVFPSLWKISYVSPIFKKGDKSKVENYRSVSIQKSMAKLFDMMVFDEIRLLIAPHLTDKQHGFMAKRSTSTNLVAYTSEILTKIEQGVEIDAVYTDFSKAFDKVPHHILIDKLHNFGFDGPILNWISSYLRNRKQYVVFDGAKSEVFDASSGVPAGTHGGPDLFLLMINDLTEILSHSNLLLYADDCKIYKQISGVNDQNLLQNDINKFDLWCEQNQLPVNIEKCTSLTFTRSMMRNSREYWLGGKKLKISSSIKDLGVDISSNLNNNLHINRIISNAMRVLGFVKRFSKDFNDCSILKTLYCSLVRPHLEYCSLVWSPYSVDGVERIERVQRKYTKFACKRMVPQRELTYKERCDYLNLETLEQRRENAGHLFIAGTLNGSIECKEMLESLHFDASQRNRRETSLFRNDRKHRTEYGRNNPITRMIRNFKNVEEKFDFILTKDEFRNRLQKI